MSLSLPGFFLDGVVLLSFVLSLAVIATLVTRGLRCVDWEVSVVKQVLVAARLVLVFVSIVGGYVLYLRHPVASPLTDTLPAGSIAIAGEILHLALGCGLLAVASAYAVERECNPAVDELFDREQSISARLHRHKWGRIGVSLVGFPLVAGLAIQLGRVGPVPGYAWAALPGLLAWGVVSYYLLTPFRIDSAGTRDPTDAERERLEQCYDRVGDSPEDIVVYASSSVQPRVFDAGRWGARLVWIHDSVLEEASDDELAVALAQAAERNRRGYWEYVYASQAVDLALVGVLVGALVSDPDLLLNGYFLAGVVGLLLLTTGTTHLARRSCYRADQFACDRLDPATVSRTYDDHPRTIKYVDHESKLVDDDYLVTEPTISDRLERIASRYDLEREPGDGAGEAETATPTSS